MILSNRSAGKEALERGAPIRAGQRAHGVIPAYMGRRGHRPRGAFHLSVSCSNHGLPRGQAYPEMMQSTADVHHQSADTLLPQADPVFDHVTALHTAVDMLDPETAVVQGLVISTWGSVKARKPRSCHNRLPVGKEDRVAAAIRFSWTRPPWGALRKRSVGGAWTSRAFVTVWSFVLPL